MSLWIIFNARPWAGASTACMIFAVVCKLESPEDKDVYLSMEEALACWFGLVVAGGSNHATCKTV